MALNWVRGFRRLGWLLVALGGILATFVAVDFSKEVVGFDPDLIKTNFPENPFQIKDEEWETNTLRRTGEKLGAKPADDFVLLYDVPHLRSDGKFLLPVAGRNQKGESPQIRRLCCWHSGTFSHPCTGWDFTCGVGGARLPRLIMGLAKSRTTNRRASEQSVIASGDVTHLCGVR